MSDVPPPPTEAVPLDGGGVFCRNCGNEMSPSSSFCAKCGQARVGVEEPMITQAAPAVATSRVVEEDVVDDVVVADSPWRPEFIALSVLVVVILLAVLFFALSSDDDTPPATTTTTFPTTITTVPPTVVVPQPIIVPQPVPQQTAPPQTQPPQTAPPQTQPPQTTATTSTTTTTTTAAP